jgi:hypothetical protein
MRARFVSTTTLLPWGGKRSPNWRNPLCLRSDLCVIIDDLRVQDEPEYHWTLVGTNSGPGGTGNTVRISGFEKWRFGADGLIAFSQGHFDLADYRRQLEQGVRCEAR